MWVRKRFDIGWRDLAWALRACLAPPRYEDSVDRLHALWAGEAQTFVGFSVRSGFDALLEVLALPKGSEVVVSPITIHDMDRILRAHGLVPVPVDLDPDTLAPTPEALRAALTPKTRLALLTHLFGARMDVGPLVEVLRSRRLLILEDCAQAYAGPAYRGSGWCDVSFFSFGVIKSSTALGGALFTVRKPELLAQLRAKQAQWPVASRRTYLKKVVKYACLKALTGRPQVGLIVRAARRLGIDYDHLMNASTRGFPGPGFFEKIRVRPCAPLAGLLARRLETETHATLDRRTALGRRLTDLLRGRVAAPGADIAQHSYWLYIVNVPDPRAAQARLRAAGFDSTQGESLLVIGPPPDRAAHAPRNAQHLLDHILLLPIYPAMTEAGVEKMAQVLCAHEA
jgi:dTDP-4-amino-4,6-dideoxygalactose transaminase